MAAVGWGQVAEDPEWVAATGPAAATWDRAAVAGAEVPSPDQGAADHVRTPPRAAVHLVSAAVEVVVVAAAVVAVAADAGE